MGILLVIGLIPLAYYAVRQSQAIAVMRADAVQAVLEADSRFSYSLVYLQPDNGIVVRAVQDLSESDRRDLERLTKLHGFPFHTDFVYCLAR